MHGQALYTQLHVFDNQIIQSPAMQNEQIYAYVSFYLSYWPKIHTLLCQKIILCPAIFVMRTVVSC